LVQNYIFIPAKLKDVYLVYILNELHGNSIFVFVNTCMAAMRLFFVLNNLGMEVVAIHGQMTQVQRLGALNKFKGGEKKILLATDVASRGLDIASVDAVINYDIPMNTKDYIHRVGRTARAGRAGKAITFVTQYDVENYQKIEQLIE
jgi:ATP-dependent RNA helicase DDX47/RRP3